VYAYYDPCPRTASTGTSDLIGGAVVVWGRIEAHIYGMRGKHARIVAVELPLSRGRKWRAVTEQAERLGVQAVPHRSLKARALEHGEVLDRALRPKKTLTRAANVWARNAPA
jgi:predicted nuclease with RNAse H fold